MPIHGIRTVYQPFSLQERMAPLNMMKEEYDKIGEGITELEMNTNQVAQYIDPSSQAGQTLAQYNQLLDETATTLSREGLKGVSRTALQNLRRTYLKEVAPINEGAKNYANLQAKIKEMQEKDPTIMVSDMPTLDDYIKNPNALPNLVSGAQLMQEGATAALQLPGVDYNAISRYMNGDTTAIPDLSTAAQSIANRYGVTTEQAMGYITSGIMNGLGQRATKLYDARQNAEMDFEFKKRLLDEQTKKSAYLENLRYGHSVSLAEKKASLNGTSSKGSGRSGASYINQVNGVVYAKGENERMFSNVKDADDAMRSTKAKYKGFFDLDKENKIRVLRTLGADIPLNASGDLIDEATMDYENELYNYTYMEYRDKKDKSSKNDEFFMIPNKVRRDTYIGGDDDYDDLTLSQGE